jgi:hypothetical protein
MSVHLFDDPAARLRLELSAPIATSGGVGVDAGDGGRVAPLSGSPVDAVHGTLLLLLRLLLDLRLGPRSLSNTIATNTTRWKKKMRRGGGVVRRAWRRKMRKAIRKIIIMRKAKDHDWAGHLGRDYMGQETWPIVFGSPFNYPKGPTQPSPSSWSVSVVSASDSPAAAALSLSLSCW